MTVVSTAVANANTAPRSPFVTRGKSGKRPGLHGAGDSQQDSRRAQPFSMQTINCAEHEGARNEIEARVEHRIERAVMSI
jgi:hypothetical protein